MAARAGSRLSPGKRPLQWTPGPFPGTGPLGREPRGRGRGPGHPRPGAPAPQVEASGARCRVPVPRAHPRGWGPAGSGERPRPAPARRRRHRPAPGSASPSPGPRVPGAPVPPPAAAAEKGFLSARRSVTNPTLTAQTAQSENGTRAPAARGQLPTTGPGRLGPQDWRTAVGVGGRGSVARLAGRMPAFVDLALVSQLCKYVPPGGGAGGAVSKAGGPSITGSM